MHDPLNTLAAITAKRDGFRSLGDVSAETTTPLDVYRFGRPRRIREKFDLRPHQRRPRERQGARRLALPQTETDPTTKSARRYAAATSIVSLCARSLAATMSATAQFRG